MARVVALLRGVNIGKRQLPMATLRTGLVAAGATDVVTYIQSGNVVLVPPRAAGRRVRGWLEETVGDIAGFEVRVVVRTAAELAALVRADPFAGAPGNRRYVVFCSADPAAALTTLEAGAERAEVVGHHVAFHVPEGMARATLPTLIERDLQRVGIVGTARNWNTVERLLELV